MSASSSKTGKLGGNPCLNMDGINRLPEDVLIHVLSYLSTKEAVRTLILSRKWEHLWASMPNLSFSDTFAEKSSRRGWYEIIETGPSIYNSIEKAFCLRNASSLKNFKLVLSKPVSASRLCSWVSAAVKHKVEKLSLNLPDEPLLVLPDGIFTSESLNSFELKMRCVLKVPSFTCFSVLAELALHNVIFPDDQSVQQLFSGCPLIERLRLFECHWEKMREITIENPTLKSFVFTDEGSSFPDYYFLNCKIIIAASNLESLMVLGNLTVEILPCNLTSLKSALIDVNRWNGEPERGRRIKKLVSGLQYVESLKLSATTLELLLLYVGNLQELLPTFYNMNELSGEVGYPEVESYSSGALVYILNKSPNLQSLRLPGGFRRWELDMMLGTLPRCFQSCLKSIFICSISGHEEELCLLKYLCKNVAALEQLTMICSSTLSEDLLTQEEIYQELVQLHRGSTGCSIKFLPYEGPGGTGEIGPDVAFNFDF